MSLHNSLISLKLRFSICKIWLLGEHNEKIYVRHIKNQCFKLGAEEDP